MAERSGRRRTASAILSTVLLCTVLQTIATAPPAMAEATIHVPADQPTISAALAVAAAGDTIVVAPGTYNEAPDFTGKDVDLVASGGPEVTTINHPSTARVRIGPGGSITGFTITGGQIYGHGGGMVAYGNGTVIRGNRFIANSIDPESHGGGGAIWGQSASPLIDSNSFERNRCGSEGVVDFAGGAPVITNNVFVDNTCGTAVDTRSTSGQVLNNTIVGGPRGIYSDGLGDLVLNNIIAWADVGISYSGGAPDHNLVWGNGLDFAGTGDPEPPGNLSADPEFVDASGKDFALQASSPAIDAGSATSAPLTDARGHVRPVDGPDNDDVAQFDIGAFERDGTEGPPVSQTGTLDRDWSVNARVETFTTYSLTMAHDGQDRLITASYRESDGKQLRLRRYESDGNLSTGFGHDGILRNFGSGLSFPTHLEPTASGGLVVVGEYYGQTARLGVARLNPDATYDPTFSGDGRATYKVFSTEHDVVSAFRAVVLGTGKIAFAVAAFDYDSSSRLQFTGQALLRVNANGTADTSFSADAKVPLTKDFSDIAFMPNGSFYAGRQVGTVHEVRRYTPGGYLDPTFSGDGITAVSCGTHRGALLTADPLGRPVLMCVRTSGTTLNLGIFRFTTTGATDPTYSGDGKTAMVLTGGSTSSVNLYFDDDGLPWAASRLASDVKSFLVHTLDTNGAPNAAWSGDGKATVTLSRTVALDGLEKAGDRLYVSLWHFTSTGAGAVIALHA